MPAFLLSRVAARSRLRTALGKVAAGGATAGIIERVFEAK
jgi:hypothetical protein